MSHSKNVLRLIGSVGIAIAVLIGSAAAADARVKTPDADSDSIHLECYRVQGLIDNLVAEYKTVGTATPNSPRLDQILAELRQLGSYMRDLHCDEYAEFSKGRITRNVNNLPVLVLEGGRS